MMTYKPKVYEHFMKMENNDISYREALRYCGIDFPDMRFRQLQFDF
jgi:aspartyl-tRNA synthetase